MDLIRSACLSFTYKNIKRNQTKSRNFLLCCFTTDLTPFSQALRMMFVVNATHSADKRTRREDVGLVTSLIFQLCHSSVDH